MAHKLLTTLQRDKAVQTAMEATAAAQRGEKTYTKGKHVFNLTKGGMCQQFVRQCVEAGNGWAPHTWEFGDNEPNAKAASINMRAAGLELPKGTLLIPGDILTHERGTHGHIGIYVQTGEVCENTSSGSRGEPRRPGTKRTPLAQFTYGHVFRLVRAPLAGVFVNGRQVAPAALLIDGKCYVPRRATADALGAVSEPVSHLASVVNGEPVSQFIRGGVGWMWARDLARLTGAAVQWSPDRIEFTTQGGE